MNIDITKKPFLIKSEKLEKLRPEFIKATKIIKQAISDRRPIIVRHHDDCDGYTAGIVLEKAILPMINDYKKYYYFTRMVSKSPYFDYTDSLRDLQTHLSGKHLLAPLMILTDLGSNNQSIKAINRLKTYGYEFIIVDHHRFDEINKNNSLAFVNPHAYGGDSNLNAGALATELALFINPTLSNINHLPALSGFADKSSGEEFEKYVKLSNLTLKELEKWSLVIDHETYYFRFNPRTEVLDDLFLRTQKNKIIVESMHEKILNSFHEIIIAVKKYAKVKEINNIKIIQVSRGEIGNYEYASSKLTRIAHESFSGPRITLSINSNHISYRADETNFDGIKLISILKEKLPYAMVGGGGHNVAGSIIFNAAAYDEVIKEFYDYIKTL